jgi:thiamine biosynthesis protein ThiS
MEITLNNTKEIIPEDRMTLDDLIRYKNFTFKMLVTRINGQLIRKEDRENVFIRSGDDIIVMHLISGG